jgi:hypothetical protein
VIILSVAVCETASAQVGTVRGRVDAVLSEAAGVLQVEYTVAVDSSTATTGTVRVSIPENQLNIESTAPDGWISAFTPGTAVIWAQFAENPAFVSGTSVRDFVIRAANSLPVLTTITVTPILDGDSAGIPVPEDEGDFPEYLATLSSMERAAGFSTQTIGLRQAPINVNPSAELLALSTTVDAIAKLGWIGADGLAQSLKAKLDAAQDALNRETMEAARGALIAFLQQLSAVNERMLRSEAASILATNATFLLNQLP